MNPRCVVGNEDRHLRPTNRVIQSTNKDGLIEHAVVLDFVVRMLIITRRLHGKRRCKLIFYFMATTNGLNSIRGNLRRCFLHFHGYLNCNELCLLFHHRLNRTRTKASRTKLGRTERASFLRRVFVHCQLSTTRRRQFNGTRARAFRVLITNGLVMHRQHYRCSTAQVESIRRVGVTLRATILAQDSISNSVNGIRYRFLTVRRRTRIVTICQDLDTIKRLCVPIRSIRFCGVWNVLLLISRKMGPLYAARKSIRFKNVSSNCGDGHTFRSGSLLLV